jgi:hypothetical protein
MEVVVSSRRNRRNRAGARVSRLIAIVAMNVSAIVALAALTPAAAQASGCTDTFTNTSGGSWSTASNWSKKAAPTSEEEACITDNGTYTVTLDSTLGTSVSVKTLVVGGASGAQHLAVSSGSGGSLELTTTKGMTVAAHGTVALTSSLGFSTTTSLGGQITNDGTIAPEQGGGGSRRLEGSVLNERHRSRRAGRRRACLHRGRGCWCEQRACAW